MRVYRPLGFERVYLPLHKVADTPFHIQSSDILQAIFIHILGGAIHTTKWMKIRRN